MHQEVFSRQREQQQLMSHFEAEMDRVYGELEAAVCATYDDYEFNKMPPVKHRADALEDNFDAFEEVTVPTLLDEKQGTLTRSLNKQHQAFELECVNTNRREKKIKIRNTDYEKSTAEAFEFEKRARFVKFTLFQEESDEAARYFVCFVALACSDLIHAKRLPI